MGATLLHAFGGDAPEVSAEFVPAGHACNRKTPLDKASWKIRAPGNRKRKSGNMIPDRGGFGDHGEGVHY